MRPLTIVAMVGVIAVLLVPSYAQAQEGCTRQICQGLGGGDDDPDGGNGGERPGGQVSAPRDPRHPHVRTRWNPDDDCWYLETTWEQQPAPAGQNERERGYFDEWTTNNRHGDDICPQGEVVDVPGLAWNVWAGTDLPEVDVATDPDRAVVGLATYLTIDAGEDITVSEPTPVGPLTVSARIVEYRVDWGDGSSTTSDGPGVSYPGGPGEITHPYTTAGSPTVSVTAVWGASWEGGGESGDLGLHERVGTHELPVRELQAVRRR